jgi:hypothetical protein
MLWRKEFGAVKDQTAMNDKINAPAAKMISARFPGVHCPMNSPPKPYWPHPDHNWKIGWGLSKKYS